MIIPSQEDLMQPSNALNYDFGVAKLFMFSTLIFGIVGMGIGTLIAFQMAYPDLNYIAGEYGTFSRLRPLHTNGVVYGFMLLVISIFGFILWLSLLR